MSKSHSGTNYRGLKEIDALLDEIEHGETTSAIDAYILQKVLAAFNCVEDFAPAEAPDTGQPRPGAIARTVGRPERRENPCSGRR